MKRYAVAIAVFLAAISMMACGSSNEEAKTSWGEAANKPAKPDPYAGLTAFEKEHGIGPVKEELKLEAINAALVKKGEKAFETKCYACHRLDTKLVGPPLQEVLKTRKPEYVMNMMLNPEGMIKNHPDAKKMFAQFLIPMANQNLTMDECRAILEYLRHANENVKKPS